MIEKNFDTWNLQKKSIDQDIRKIVFNEGDVWWCSLGLNIGEEAYGKGDKFRRPILVIKKLSATTCGLHPDDIKNPNRIMVPYAKYRWYRSVLYAPSDPLYEYKKVLSSYAYHLSMRTPRDQKSDRCTLSLLGIVISPKRESVGNPKCMSSISQSLEKSRDFVSGGCEENILRKWRFR